MKKKNKYTNEQLMRSVPVRQAVLQLSLPTLLGALMGLVMQQVPELAGLMGQAG